MPRTYMYASVRTTLVLDDQLFRRAKREAVSAGTTLSEFVNAALRKYLFGERHRQREERTFSMPVFGEPASLHQTPEQLSALRDDGR